MVGDRAEVDVLEHPFVVGDRSLGHLDAEFALGAQHGEPLFGRSATILAWGDQMATIAALA